jgi:hypothetical protein
MVSTVPVIGIRLWNSSSVCCLGISSCAQAGVNKLTSMTPAKACFISGSGFISNSSLGAIPKLRHAPRLFGQIAPPPDGGMQVEQIFALRDQIWARLGLGLAVAPPIISSSEPPRSAIQAVQTLWA